MQVITWFVETWPQLWQVWMAIGIAVFFLVAWHLAEKMIGPMK